MTSHTSKPANTTSNTIRLAGYQGDASILTQALKNLTRGVQSRLPGQSCDLDIDVTASGQSANALFASIEAGDRQIAYMASSYLSARVPELGVLDIPFSVSDRAHALAALDTGAGDMIKHAVAEKTAYHVLGFWDNGFRHISNRIRPIRSPQDCTGLLIRTLDNDGYRSLLAALGFTARTIDVKDLVRAVGSGEVDAQENPLTNLLTFSLWRYHSYVSLTGHFFGVLLLVCHRDWFFGQSAQAQAQLTLAVSEATQLQRQLASAADALALDELRAHGVEILEPQEIDMTAFRQQADQVILKARQALNPDLIRAYLGNPISFL
jgi:TRAP-type C4-dicarboxylate transport system substrate-binding protein